MTLFSDQNINHKLSPYILQIQAEPWIPMFSSYISTDFPQRNIWNAQMLYILKNIYWLITNTVSSIDILHISAYTSSMKYNYFYQ